MPIWRCGLLRLTGPARRSVHGELVRAPVDRGRCRVQSPAPHKKHGSQRGRATSRPADAAISNGAGEISMRRLCIIICCGVFMLVACSSQTPKTTGGLGDKLPLAPGQYPGTLVYRSPTLDTSSGKYKALFVDDADIYHAADADFGSASQADKERLA